MERLFREIAPNVRCPFAEIQGIIFHTEGLTPEEMVDRMLAYRPIQLLYKLGIDPTVGPPGAGHAAVVSDASFGAVRSGSRSSEVTPRASAIA
jgi:hypothetical protein